MQEASEALVSLGAVFTLLFVTLGPMKIIVPFAQLTRDADAQQTRRIAVGAFALSTLVAIAGGFLGRGLLESWNVPVAALLFAGGLVFLVVALRLVLEQYEPEHRPPPPLPAETLPAALRITFPSVVTPYGIAALIVLLANSSSGTRTASILAILVGVMACNLLAMLFARQATQGAVALALQFLGAVLGVVQLALAVEMIVIAVRSLRVVQP